MPALFPYLQSNGPLVLLICKQLIDLLFTMLKMIERLGKAMHKSDAFTYFQASFSGSPRLISRLKIAANLEEDNSGFKGTEYVPLRNLVLETRN